MIDISTYRRRIGCFNPSKEKNSKQHNLGGSNNVNFCIKGSVGLKSGFLIYKDIIDYIVANNFLPKSDETWKRKPCKRSDLEDLATIKVNMSEQEIEKRIRATFYTGKPAPFIELAGYKFEYNPKR